ncbi:MAG: hypothetical protein WCW84_13820 [Sulfurimonas sp.]|jgi:hypothetical protein
MKIETEYSIGDIVKVKYLSQEWEPVVAAHIIESTGVIDGINIDRNGITYSVFVDGFLTAGKSIVSLVKNGDPADIVSPKHFHNMIYHRDVAVQNKHTGVVYTRYGVSRNEIALYPKEGDEFITINESELMNDYRFYVDVNAEPKDDLSIKGGKAYLIEDNNWNEQHIVYSNNIKRFCEMFDASVVKQVKTKTSKKS